MGELPNSIDALITSRYKLKDTFIKKKKHATWENSARRINLRPEFQPSPLAGLLTPELRIGRSVTFGNLLVNFRSSNYSEVMVLLEVYKRG